MALLVTDLDLQKKLIARRRRWGADHLDEVWNGTYVMAPEAGNEHQDFQAGFIGAFRTALTGGGALVLGTLNISDRQHRWKHNYRVPDINVFMPGHQAINCETHWFGGPDFAVEIVSPRDRSRKKLKFYASVGVRELLVVDRDPYAMEFYVSERDELRSVARLESQDSKKFISSVLPLDFRWIEGPSRPLIEVTERNGGRNWIV